MRNKIRDAICELAYLDQSELEDSTPLFSGGLIDSVSLLEMVVLLESESQKKVSPSDINLENFDSVDSIVSFYDRLSG